MKSKKINYTQKLRLPDNKRKWLIYGALFLFAFLLYGNTINHDYNLDDELVTRNHRLTSKGISAIAEIFTSPYYQDDSGYSYEYRPVVLVSFALEHELFGDNPKASHLINVLLYAITGIILFILLTNLFPNLNVIFPVSAVLLFIAHPMHTEVVSSIKNRDEMLSFLFGILALNYMARTIKFNLHIKYILVFFFLLLSLLSKTSGIFLLGLIPIVLIYKKEEKLSLLYSFFIVALLTAITIYISSSNMQNMKMLLTGFTVYYIILYIIFYLKLNTTVIAGFFTRIKMIKERIGWPESTLLHKTSFKEITLGNLLFYLLFIAIFTLFVKYSMYIGSVPALILLIFYPFYSRLIRYDIIILTIVAFIIFYIFSPLDMLTEAIFYIVALYLIIINIYLNKNNKKQLVLVIIFLMALSCIAIYLRFNEFQTVIGYLFLIIIVSLLIYIIKKYKYKWLYIPFLHMIFTSFIDIVLYFHLYELNVFSFYILSYILFLTKYRSNAKASLLLISISLSFVLCINVVHKNIMLNKSPEHIELKRLHEEKMKNTPPSEVKIEEPKDNYFFNMDRPLDFVEYPLGFNASMEVRIATSAYILGEYLKLLIIPHPMGFYYGYAHIVPVGIRNPQASISLIIYFTLLIISLLLIKKHPGLCLGILFYLFSIAVYTNLIQPVAGMMADRFTYAASFGFCIAITYALLNLFKIDISKNAPLKLKPAFTVVLVLILSSYSYLTIARNALWKDHLTLMRHDIGHLDKSAQAHNLLASNLMKYSYQNEYSKDAFSMRKEALGHFKRAVEIYPGFFNAWYDLGRTYMILNHPDSAFHCFVRVHEMDSTFSDATINIATIAEQRNDFNTAIKYYERLLKAQPDYYTAYTNLSYLYFRLNQPEKSIETNQRAIKIFPTWRDPYENIARVYISQGDTLSAQEFLKNAPR